MKRCEVKYILVESGGPDDTVTRDANQNPLLIAAIRRAEDGFTAVKSAVVASTPRGTPFLQFALGGLVEEGASIALTARTIEAAVRQFERDFTDWLLPTTDGRRSGYVLWWRERPNFIIRRFKPEVEDRLLSTVDEYLLWWRCAVEPCENPVSETGSRS